MRAIVSKYTTVRDVQLEQSAQAAVQFGLNANAAAVAVQLPVHCQSGNCTWTPFHSLAVCSRCSDVSHLMKSSSRRDYPMGWYAPNSPWGSIADGPQDLIQYYLPNGLSINNRANDAEFRTRAWPVVATAFSDLRPSTSLTFKQSTTLLFSTTVLRVPDSDFPAEGAWPQGDAAVEATECGIYLCIKEYDSRVENGLLIENSKVVSAVRNPKSFNVTIDGSVCGGDCGYLDFRISTEVDALFSNTTFFPRTDLKIDLPRGVSSNNGLASVNVTQAGVDSLSSFILSLSDQGMYQNVSQNIIFNEEQCFDDGSPIPCGGLRNISGMATGPGSNPGQELTATNFAPAIMQQLWGSPNLTATFENLANSITNEMRNNKTGQTGDFRGQVGIVRTVLRVRWQWIALPAFLLAVSTLFFTLTAFESSRTSTPLWKGSSLAVLYHGLEAKVRSALEHWDLPSQMSDASEEVKVRLRRDVVDDCKYPFLFRCGGD
jgi:hypothetical protein